MALWRRRATYLRMQSGYDWDWNRSSARWSCVEAGIPCASRHRRQHPRRRQILTGYQPLVAHMCFSDILQASCRLGIDVHVTKCSSVWWRHRCWNTKGKCSHNGAESSACSPPSHLFPAQAGPRIEVHATDGSSVCTAASVSQIADGRAAAWAPHPMRLQCDSPHLIIKVHTCSCYDRLCSDRSATSDGGIAAARRPQLMLLQCGLFIEAKLISVNY